MCTSAHDQSRLPRPEGVQRRRARCARARWPAGRSGPRRGPSGSRSGSCPPPRRPGSATPAGPRRGRGRSSSAAGSGSCRCPTSCRRRTRTAPSVGQNGLSSSREARLDQRVVERRRHHRAAGRRAAVDLDPVEVVGPAGARCAAGRRRTPSRRRRRRTRALRFSRAWSQPRSEKPSRTSIGLAGAGGAHEEQAEGAQRGLPDAVEVEPGAALDQPPVVPEHLPPARAVDLERTPTAARPPSRRCPARGRGPCSRRGPAAGRCGRARWRGRRRTGRPRPARCGSPGTCSGGRRPSRRR